MNMHDHLRSQSLMSIKCRVRQVYAQTMISPPTFSIQLRLNKQNNSTLNDGKGREFTLRLTNHRGLRKVNKRLTAGKGLRHDSREIKITTLPRKQKGTAQHFLVLAPVLPRYL